MTDTAVRSVIIGELRTRGCELADGEDEVDLIAAGVNSVNLVRILTALEERFDIEFEASGFFAQPVTVARLEAEVNRHLV
ncbi:acyl carrier protein [Nocardia sp. NPDC059764]|uniref:acyl carrier protein n=1 Tax=Nocardia sp. NPDC059764 TaxID=3346939 RepID=UPI0036507246